MSTLPLLLEPAELIPALGQNNLLIVDLSRRAVYEQAHVPGAVHLDFGLLQAGVQPAPGKLPDNAQLSQVLSSIGLTADKHVIAYDDEGGGWAGRLIWTLDMIGHSQYSYLNGGIHAWLAEAAPTESGETTVEPSNYQVSELQSAPSVDKEHIMQRLGQDDFAIWDARSYDEFTGGRAFAQRAGHIPGAKHFEWTSAMDRERSLRVMDLEALQQHLDSLGLSKDKEIVTHCQTHHRSSYTYLLGKILGYPNIRAYPGSWSEWGNAEDTPIETGDE